MLKTQQAISLKAYFFGLNIKKNDTFSIFYVIMYTEGMYILYLIIISSYINER